MSKIQKESTSDRVSYAFYCPACETVHRVTDGWQFNGDFDKPTFSPSILVRSGHYLPEHSGSCWCTFNEAHPDNPVAFKCGVCHSFVRDGQIEFLSDCTHHLAEKTVEIPDWEV